jgi:hypothetical protein
METLNKSISDGHDYLYWQVTTADFENKTGLKL